MKIVKKQKRYCPYCKKHTEHKVVIPKNKPKPKTKKRALKWGVRHYAWAIAGYKGSVRPVANPVKTSKHIALRYECLVCGKKHFKQNTIRAKRVEQV